MLNSSTKELSVLYAEMDGIELVKNIYKFNPNQAVIIIILTDF